MPFPSAVRRAVATLAPILAAATPAIAADHFLTIGGGDAPSHNQVSLESNVLYLQRVLGDIGAGGASHDVFFADGSDVARDLQTRPGTKLPRVNQLLARVLMNNEQALGIAYRDGKIPNVRGPSNRKSLADWFDNTGAKLAAGDRLVIYFTGHGGRGTPPRNTTITLWREKSMPVKEFVGLLDKVPAGVPVVLVMVQCHAGGFADVLFKDGAFGSKPDALSAANRCGFFATVPERPAAGCTPDINEDNYHEYSTYFFEAMSGRSRTGSAVEKPDYDGDGKISFAEAHAYVKLTSNTIDLPVCTSDAFLRAFSRTSGGPARPTPPATAPADNPRPRRRGGPGGGVGNVEVPTAAECAADETSPSTKPTAKPVATTKPAATTKPVATTRPATAPAAADARLLNGDSPYQSLAAAADPARKAVLDGLSAQLKLSGPDRSRGARDLANQLQRERDGTEGQKRNADKAANTARDRIAQAVRAKWPELATPFHPLQAAIVRDEAEAVVKYIETHPDYKEFDEQRDLAETFGTKSLELERKWVKTQRFLRTAEEVALAANLPVAAGPELQKRYKALLAAEYGVLDGKR